MTEMHNNGKEDDPWLLLLWLSVEVGCANTTTNHRWERCRQVGGGLQNEQRAAKRQLTMPMRRASKVEEDNINDKEDVCAPAAAAATAAAAALTGCHQMPPRQLCHCCLCSSSDSSGDSTV